MNGQAKFFALVACAFLLLQTAVGQDPQTKSGTGGMRRMVFNSDNALIVREIGAVITEEKGVIKIMMIPPKERRPEGMQDVDLVAGDEVGMAGGKHVKSLKELKEAYEHAAVGEPFKLGVRRDGQAHVVSFVRKAEKDKPQGGQLVIRRDGPGGDENSEFFPAFGIGIVKKDNAVQISETLPHAPKDLKKGDVIKSLNGKGITTVADFSKEFDATKIGSTLSLVLLRDGKEVTVSAPRPEPKGRVIMKKD